METLPLTWRAVEPADAAAIARLLAAAEEVDRTGEHYSEADIVEEMDDPSLDLARDTLAAVTPDGELVAYGGLRGSVAVRDVDRVHCDGVVRPDLRGRGLGRRILAWASDRATAMHAAGHPSVPGALMVNVPSTVPSKEALVRSFGFQPERWWYTMHRDLSVALPPVPSSPFSVVPYSASRDEELRQVHIEAFAGHWGSTPPDEQRWAHWYTGATAFQPSISLLALDGDAIAAYVNAYCWEAETAATGIREAYIGQIGARPAYRRRGLGTLMLAHALHGFAAAGYARSALNVDTGNTTNALTLYERAGYTVAHEVVSWSRPLT